MADGRFDKQMRAIYKHGAAALSGIQKQAKKPSSLPVSHWTTRGVIREELLMRCFRGILIMDFEATCAEGVRVRNPEII